jgi:dTDP-L-rhamnose 4-epimerase
MSPKDCILITGAAGFIGTSLRRAIRADLPLIGIDSFVADVHPYAIRDVDSINLEILYPGNVLDSDLMDTILSDWHPKIVVHLAAETGTGVSAVQQARHVSNNSLGTARLLEALERNGRIPETVILSSSRAVYGDGLWFDNEGDVKSAVPRTALDLKSEIWNPRSPAGDVLVRPVPQSAAHLPNPANVYALTKYSQEKLVQFWCDRLDAKYQILRFQNVYGPGQSAHNPYTGIVNVFGNIASSGAAIPVYEDGQILRDFIFIDDIVSGIQTFMFNLELESGIYDLGSGVPTTIQDLANLVSSYHEAEQPKITSNYRFGDVRSAFASADSRPPGWLPRVSLEDGIRQTLAWLSTQTS